MSTWFWIALPLLFVVGLFVGALKDTKQIEKFVKKNRDKMHLKDWDTEERKRDDWGVPPGDYHADDKDNKDKETKD
ncbi:hypothetical protein [Oceanisphaera arctica]|uniref:DUF2897 domain-containing protein n=1 Tax=Oceanisphaera arctica TaxID=641510 RepID=A0A2P5TRS9_9GAMM|nr:hypothetical protein [Oceanisphaera arctica]PPL18538.1 hypothetical protein UN63_00935 [Oceanisphaera arctica]GHA17208.1 hypothetical protein GCM10007082_17400 [Oceanisphaera arctica]